MISNGCAGMNPPTTLPCLVWIWMVILMHMILLTFLTFGKKVLLHGNDVFIVLGGGIDSKRK